MSNKKARHPKVVVTDRNFTTSKISNVADVVQYSNSSEIELREWLLSEISDADVLYCRGPLSVDKELINAGHQLKAIVTISVGFENIDVEECKRKGVKLGYAGDILTEATAEMCLAVLLTTSRRILEAVNIASHSLPTCEFYGKGVANSIVGFFGLGRIGESIARKIEPFRPAKIIYHNRRPKDCSYEYVSFDELVSQSDFLIISVKAEKESYGKFDKSVFSQMKRDSVLVNISRGKIVHTMDLYDALKNNIIGAAGLDVVDPEPLPLDHLLYTLKNCVITPHIGSANYISRRRMLQLGEENVVNAVLGTEMTSPLNV